MSIVNKIYVECRSPGYQFKCCAGEVHKVGFYLRDYISEEMDARETPPNVVRWHAFQTFMEERYQL